MRIETRIELTDSEWMNLIIGDESRPEGMVRCCANISTLRDRIIRTAREGGQIDSYSLRGLREAMEWVEGGHEINMIPALAKLRDQLESINARAGVMP